jgi:uncharacterized membrane protein HdeD (DUF308 family)
MTSAGPSKLLPHLWKANVFCGLVAVALGGLILAQPGISTALAAILFGAYFLTTIIPQTLMGFSRRGPGFGRLLLFVSMAASLALAVAAILHLYDPVPLLAIGVGVAFAFRGVATMFSVVNDLNSPESRWSVVIGVLSLLAGVVVLAWPFAPAHKLSFVDALCLVVVGMLETLSALGIWRARGVRSTKPQRGVDAAGSDEDVDGGEAAADEEDRAALADRSGGTAAGTATEKND